MDWLIDGWNSFTNWVVNSWNGLIQFLGDILRLIGDGWNKFWGNVGLGWNVFWQVFWDGWDIFWGAIGQWIGDGVQSIGNTIVNAAAEEGSFWQPFAQFLLGAIELASDLIEIGRLVLEIVGGLFRLMMNWIGQSMSLLAEIFNRYQNATPLPIAGLPRCVSAPMESEYCALVYVAEHTIFQNQQGDIIILLIIILIDIWMIFYLIRFILGLVQRGQTTTDA